jgi:hypothetical protein
VRAALVLGTPGRELAQVLQAAGQPVARALEFLETEQTRARDGLLRVRR